MAEPHYKVPKFEALRKRAEEILRNHARKEITVSDMDILSLIHELEVHQVELEMQNEELQRAGRELEESRSRYMDLYNYAPVGYLTLTPRGVITDENLCASEMLGRPKRDQPHSTFQNFIHPPDLVKYNSLLREAAEGEDRRSFELTLRRPDRTLLPVHIEISAVRREDGALVGWRMTMTDISRLKEMETDLIKANEQLRREIAERKRTEQLLLQQSARLEESNKNLQDFAFVASHDLQEPLRKIQAFGDRIRTQYRASLDEVGLDYLERMMNAAKRMQVLIRDLLEYSRVATKARPFSRVDLNVLIRDVLTDLETSIDLTKGTVEVGPLPEIEVDRHQMRQLFQNIIANSLKFHGDEPPVVKIYASPRDEGENGGRQAGREELPDNAGNPESPAPFQECCRIVVEDNGIGFDERHLERIFMPFQRLHGRSRYEGTGMGLAICRRIVQRHGGSITARSTPGRGTTFIITLPVSHTTESNAAGPAC